MVSIVLLTTEEILQRNKYWQCLDSVWITQEMEPFEDIKPEHIYSKPLSRDIYYAKYPDIPRSESEDEISFTVNGFKNKHQEWKSKICIKKFELQRRNISNSASSTKSGNNNSVTNDVTKRITSFNRENKEIVPKTFKDNDERVRDFLKRLIENVPPPPILDEDLISEDGHNDIIKPHPRDMEDIEIPDYADFENDRICHTNNEKSMNPRTSTLKKSNINKINFNDSSFYSDSDEFESWYETIYGVSGFMEMTENEINSNQMTNESDYFISWNEIINMCGISDSVLKSRESLDSENLISQSHYVNNSIVDLSDDDDETAYAKFAVNKLRQSLKIKGQIRDSSSIENLNNENVELLKPNVAHIDPSLYRIFYGVAANDEEIS